MKTILYFLIAFSSLSCINMKEDTYYLRTTGRVEIIQVDIPDTTINLEFAEIIAKAKATNACWSNLTFNLTKKSDFEYFLEAFGIFESYGSCPDVMVYSDSTIPFKPTQTGLYKFYITKTQNEIETDTMIVIGDN